MQARLVGSDSDADADAVRSPVCGFFLFDAVDQALEAFDPEGAPLGQLRQDRVTHQVAWQRAPSRTRRELADVQPAVLKDILQTMLAPPVAAAPGTPPGTPPGPSALQAALAVLEAARFSVGRRLASDDHRAALCGRPVVVLRARLSLELAGVGPSESPTGAPTSKPDKVLVRLGCLDQIDDGLLGCFLRDGDTWHLHCVPHSPRRLAPPRPRRRLTAPRSVWISRLSPRAPRSTISRPGSPARWRRNDCTFCGDGILQPGETCDDGNTVDNDACRTDCLPSRQVFVTNDIFVPSKFNGVAGADAACVAAAKNLPTTGTWVAWLSDSTSSPALRMANDANFAGWYQLLDGTPVAKGFAGLTSGTLMAPINLTETMLLPQEPFFTWTNTNPDGSVADAVNHCTAWTKAGDTTAIRGDLNSQTVTWTSNGIKDYSNAFHLYCFEVTK